MKKVILFIIVFFIFYNAGAAENKSNTALGMMVSFQQAQVDIACPIRTSNSFMIAPVISVSYMEDIGSTFGFGLAPRFYMNDKECKANTLKPFISAKAAFVRSSPDNGPSTTDFIIGISYGGEYFISSNFSVGLEAQLNFVKSDDNSGLFGNPGGINVNTGGSLFASIYFD